MVKISALAATLALLTPAAAQADAFVPADPTVKGACGAAADDIVAGGREFSRRQVTVAEAGAPALRFKGLRSCPVVAAAADGTALLSADDDESEPLLVRPPGGEFAQRGVAHSYVAPPAVAAAPGGWAAAAWAEFDGTRERLVVDVFAPGGPGVREAVLARPRSGDTIEAPGVGIDASGVVTVVWGATHRHGGAEIRTAQSAGGEVWGPQRRFAVTGDDPLSSLQRAAAVAVSPGGRVLLAWVSGHGLTVEADGGEAQQVAADPSVESPSPAVTDDGTALVAYDSDGGPDAEPVHVVDRVPGGAWSAPALLSPAHAPATSGSQEVAVLVHSVLTPDGRAVVAWDAAADFGVNVFASAGRPGGVWSRATAVSSPARVGGIGSLALGATGDPELLWSEWTSIFARGDRLRADRLVATAPPADTVAPRLIARLPERVRTAGRGALSVNVPVRCADGCDVRARLIGRYGEVAWAVTDLGPGERATLHVAADDDKRRPFVRHPQRHLRLDVIAADRAGNVTRRSRVVAVSRRRAASARPAGRRARPASRA
jgi:hypothetical protein